MLTRTWYEYGYDWGHTYLREEGTGKEFWNGYATFWDQGPQRVRVRPYYFFGTPGWKETYLYGGTFKHEFNDRIAFKTDLGIMQERDSGYISRSSKSTEFGGAGKVSLRPSRQSSLDFQVDWELWKGNTLTTGLGFRREWAGMEEWGLYNWRLRGSKTTLNNFSEGRTRTWAIYFQDEMDIVEDVLALYVGARFDHWHAFDGRSWSRDSDIFFPMKSVGGISPKAGIVYRPFKSTKLRLSGGEAFRPPNAYELYRTWHSTWGTLYKSNPSLMPETTRSWEVGWEQKFWDKTKFSATYFENYVHDLIFAATDPADPKVRIRENADRADTKGVELSLEHEFCPWLSGFVNYTSQRFEIAKWQHHPQAIGCRVPYSPKEMFNFGADFRHGPVKVGIAGHYVGKIYTRDDNADRTKDVFGTYGPTFTLDAKASWEITKWAEISLGVDNITNEEQYMYYLMPGRTVFAEFTLSF